MLAQTLSEVIVQTPRKIVHNRSLRGQCRLIRNEGKRMRFYSWLIAGPVLSCMFIVGFPAHLSSQQPDSNIAMASVALPDAPQPQAAPSQPKTQEKNQSSSSSAAQAPADDTPAANKLLPQPKRILGVMPNYRAVSAGVLPPPPTSREAFMIATEDSFDYSAFVFVGITSLMAKGADTWPQLGKGPDGLWDYYWRGFLDKTDGNYWVFWAMPTVLHQDERYYAMGEGHIVRRGVYAATRVLITPNYHGKNTFNTSEIVGRAASQAISLTYYPSGVQTASAYTSKFAFAIGRDALTNVFREFWPDIDSRLLHRHR